MHPECALLERGARWQLMITARAGQFHGAPPHHHSDNQLIEFTTEQD
jgi:hypothetical protein